MARHCVEHAAPARRLLFVGGLLAICSLTASGVTAVHAAFIATTANTANTLDAGTVVIAESHGAATALYTVTGAQPGAFLDRCVRLRSTGTLDSELRHSLTASGDLLPHLQLRVTRGALASGGTSSSCTGFVPDAGNVIGQGAGVLHDGPLAALGADWATGRADPTGGGIPGGSYATAVAATTGLVNHWRLGDASTTTITDSKAGAAGAGTWVGDPATAPGVLGAAERSRRFDGADRGSVPRQVQDDFTIAFWFRSTQGLGAGPQWWQAAGLVDAEVDGYVDDFGVALRADGSVIAGTGGGTSGLDASISSPAGLHDGEWHHVAFTRTRSTGAMVLVVDGNQVASGTGSTASLTSPARLWLGAVNDGTNFYVGDLDEVSTWSRALTTAEVRALLVAGAPTPSVTETWSKDEVHDYRLRISVLDTPFAQGGKNAQVAFAWEARNR